MKKKNFVILFICFFILTSSCGFKVVNQSEYINFKIVEINTIGEKRINYKLKNNLLLNTNKENEKIITITLDTTKKRSIKEKNIKNEITKYLITVNANIKFREINKNKLHSFSIIEARDYDLANKYSETLNKEKNYRLDIREIS